MTAHLTDYRRRQGDADAHVPGWWPVAPLPKQAVA